MIKTIKYLFQAILIYFFILIGKIIGLSLSRKIFAFVFKKIGPLFRSNNIIKENLNKFKKDISNIEIKKIKNNMWSNYGMTFIEYIFLKQFRFQNSHINIEGEEILDKIYRNKKPVVFISGHFANFELMSMEITKKKINLATIYRPLNNYFLNPFMEYLRKKYICKKQIKKGINGVKKIIKLVKSQHSIALMIDQRVSEGEKIEFFNHEALTTTLPAQIAFKYNLEIVPIFIERNVKEKFNIKVYNPINISNFKSKIKLSKKLNEILEEMVTTNPNQWIWTHNRWK